MINRYHNLIVITHWLSAMVVIGTLGLGMGVLADMHNSNPDKIDVLRIHMIGGMFILIMSSIRIAVRLWKPVPSCDHFENPWLNRAAHWMHILLYVVLLGILTSGVGISVLPGLPEIVFQGIGQLPSTFRFYPPHATHGALAGIFTILLLLHIIAATYHQLIRNDGIFARMWFGRVNNMQKQ
ncbi:MAG: cytochrome b/b6 domain-containing protein [Candidatus Thiodiazotropha sp. (ex Monitilora ramsayi)]|nr:cytochrome b/b6 domain-containing protein [Candidatus Thiodiazotropha sp. (ex Monitilora ramsayi)]